MRQDHVNLLVNLSEYLTLLKVSLKSINAQFNSIPAGFQRRWEQSEKNCEMAFELANEAMYEMTDAFKNMQASVYVGEEQAELNESNDMAEMGCPVCKKFVMQQNCYYKLCTDHANELINNPNLLKEYLEND